MYKLKKELHIVCLLTILLPTLTACGLTTSIPKANTYTSTAQRTETPYTIPTALPSVTPTDRPTPTIAPTVEAPQFWIENQTVLEQNGYALVASATGWEVQYKEQTVFTDKEAEYTRFTPISTDAGPSLVFTQVDEEGKVEKFYNPQVNPDYGRPEWEDYLDISLDPTSPSEVDIDQVHSGQVLLSALIKNGTEQWWEEGATPFRYDIPSSVQFTSLGYKVSQILMWPDFDVSEGTDNLSEGRFLGFIETNYASERIVGSMIQRLVSTNGETITLTAGYSGEILQTVWNDDGTPYIQHVTFRSAGDEIFFLYKAVDDYFNLIRLGISNYVGVRLLYEQDPNNKPYKYFHETVQQLQAVDTANWSPDQNISFPRFTVDNEILRKLQFMVLYPIDQH